MTARLLTGRVSQRLSVLGAAAATLMLMVACSPAGARDGAARAQLDYTNETIVYPISPFVIGDADEIMVSQAREAIYRKCMSGKGISARSTSVAPSARRMRPYGIWNLDWAQRYGFGRPPAEEQRQPGAEQDSRWQAARESCGQQLAEQLASVTPPEMLGADLVSSRIIASAHEQASADPEWTKAIQEWHACLTKRGLTPRPQPGTWSSQQAQDIADALLAAKPAQAAELKEREIRVATSEAQCNAEVRLTQRLADLESGYQAAQIRGEEAALEQEKATNAQIMTAARAAISR